MNELFLLKVLLSFIIGGSYIAFLLDKIVIERLKENHAQTT